MERETVRRERKSKRLLEMRGKGDQTIRTERNKERKETKRHEQMERETKRLREMRGKGDQTIRTDAKREMKKEKRDQTSLISPLRMPLPSADVSI